MLSHLAAGHGWGFLPEGPSLIDISIVGRNPRPRDGVRIQPVRRLDPPDLARRQLPSPLPPGPCSTLPAEVDGFAFHSTRAAFERDRLRDAELQARGLAVLRVTWRQIVDEPDALVARLARALTRPRERLSSGEWR